MTKSISLSYKDGGSDKVYNAFIKEKDGKFVVDFTYGRRGNALTAGTKTTSPVDIESANKIFDKLVKEKTSKGYKADSDAGEEYQASSNKEDTGMIPQLLNPIDECDVEGYVKDLDYVAQEKHDGRRIGIRKIGNEVIGANRKGQRVPLPTNLVEAILKHGIDFDIDGELVGEKYFVFDITSHGTKDKRSYTYNLRLNLLWVLIHEGPNLQIVDTAYTHKDKLRMFHELQIKEKEGIVFKRIDASYVAGRPNSGGPQLKFKFYATASFIVLKVNTQRSVLLGLHDPSLKKENSQFAKFVTALHIVEAGNVTIPANHEVPTEGDVVEVRYLYAFKESGSVYQPSYLGERDDIGAGECTVDQLKYKATEE